MTTKQYTDQELRELFERRERAYTGTVSSQRRHELLFEPYNVSHAELRVLALLLFSGGSEPSVMADSLLILRQSMTKIIDSLEEKGFAVRTEHPSDRRRFYVKLRPAGEDIARELLSVESDFLSRVKDFFTEEEMDTYHALSTRIRTTRSMVLRQIVEERGVKCE